MNLRVRARRPHLDAADLVAVPDGVGPAAAETVLVSNFWAGERRLGAFRARLREDLTHVLRLLAGGVLTPQIAAEFPLADAAAAVESVPPPNAGCIATAIRLSSSAVLASSTISS